MQFWTTVFPGQTPEHPVVPDALDGDDDPAAILGGTKAYIRDFEQSLSGSHSAQELVDKMMAMHGDRGNPYPLWTAAQGAFTSSKQRSSHHDR
jgi:hypothetical protein